MSVQYTVKDVLKILIKKWYILIGITAIFILVAFPISNKVYEYDLKHYNANMDFDHLLSQAQEKVSQRVESEEKKALKSDSSELLLGDLISDSPSGRLIMLVEADEEVQLLQDEERENTLEEIKKDLVSLIWSDAFLIDCYNYLVEEQIVSYEYLEFKSNINTKAFESGNTIEITFNKIFDDKIQQEIDFFLSHLITVYYRTTNKNIDLKLLSLEEFSELQEPEKPQLSEDAIKLALQQLEFNQKILRKPTKHSNHVKLTGTAGIFGLLAACFIVLVIDYCRVARKIRVGDKNEKKS